MGAIDDFLRTSRKFNVSIYSATQTWDLPSGLRSSFCGNCYHLFAFASSASDAAFLAKEFGGPDGALVGEMLPELKTGQALVKVRGKPVILLRVRPAGSKPTCREIEEGRAQCLRLGVSREVIDKEIEQRRRQFMSGGKIKARREPDDPSCSSVSEIPEGYEGL